MKMSSSSSSEPGDNLQSLVGNEHLSEDCVISSDSLDSLKDLKVNNLRNPFLGYLNINHLRKKICGTQMYSEGDKFRMYLHK